eukprot:1157822-Pelagomonas_calceolata.AAC.11
MHTHLGLDLFPAPPHSVPRKAFVGAVLHGSNNVEVILLILRKVSAAKVMMLLLGSNFATLHA